MHTLCVESWIVQRTRRLCAGPLWTDWAAFCKGILCPQAIFVYGFASECQGPPIWGHDSSQCHGTQESAKSLMLSGITVTFRTLFLRFDVPAPLGVASGPASRRPWDPSFFSSIMCRYPSRFEVCGGTREDNLTRPWQRSHPLCSGIVPVRQHRKAHSRSQPEGSQDTRDVNRSRRRGKFHISRFRLCRKLAYFTAPPLPTKSMILRGPHYAACVHSRPSGQGEPHPTLYHTDLFTTSKMETDAHCISFTTRRSRSFQRFCGDTACRKAACLNGNRAEIAVRRQRVNCVYLNNFSKQRSIA